jgi:hypothetical protein
MRFGPESSWLPLSLYVNEFEHFYYHIIQRFFQPRTITFVICSVPRRPTVLIRLSHVLAHGKHFCPESRCAPTLHM